MITQTSDPTLWAQLYAQWVEEGRPAYLAVGTTCSQYSVHQQTDGTIGFMPQTTLDSVEGMYESTSLGGD